MGDDVMVIPRVAPGESAAILAIGRAMQPKWKDYPSCPYVEGVPSIIQTLFEDAGSPPPSDRPIRAGGEGWKDWARRVMLQPQRKPTPEEIDLVHELLHEWGERLERDMEVARAQAAGEWPAYGYGIEPRRPGETTVEFSRRLLQHWDERDLADEPEDD
jgi:hypothetical protein